MQHFSSPNISDGKPAIGTSCMNLNNVSGGVGRNIKSGNHGFYRRNINDHANVNFMNQVKESLKESPSEHSPYEQRLKNVWTDFNVQYLPNTVLAFRKLKEHLNYDAPLTSCCSKSTDSTRQDPDDENFNPKKHAPDDPGIGGSVIP